jgi:hypothetical protein
MTNALAAASIASDTQTADPGIRVADGVDEYAAVISMKLAIGGPYIMARTSTCSYR